mmetsp:Transcript_19422/g.29194  ORF Transcript_19422/g.29194 Transcript_19422/m.29194 type:complete len:140 (+) Transcript_19422:57-476(+)
MSNLQIVMKQGSRSGSYSQFASLYLDTNQETTQLGPQRPISDQNKESSLIKSSSSLRKIKEAPLSRNLESILRDELRQHIAKSRSYTNVQSREPETKKKRLMNSLRYDIKSYKTNKKHQRLCSSLKNLSLSCPRIPEEE